MEDLNGKVAVVTGGGSGIGAALARAFAAAGMKVAVADIEGDAAADMARTVNGTAHLVDVADQRSVQSFADEVFKAHGRVDLLCNNAGVAVAGPLHEMTGADWDWVTGVNLDGVIHGLLAFLPRMRDQGTGGHILNTASMAGLIPMAGLGVYVATKFAVVAISEVLALDLAEDDIGVTVLCPGMVKTRINQSDRNRPGVTRADGGVELEDLLAVDPSMANAVDVDVCAQKALEAVRANRMHVVVGNEDWYVGTATRRHGRILDALRAGSGQR